MQKCGPENSDNISGQRTRLPKRSKLPSGTILMEKLFFIEIKSDPRVDVESGMERMEFKFDKVRLLV